MKKEKLRRYFGTLILLFTLFAFAEAQTLEIQITNIRSKKGRLEISVYNNAGSFDNDKPFLTRIYSKKGVSEGKIKIQIDLNPGVYGIALLDDENSNGKMDYKLLRIPKEGFGFAEYPKKIKKRPHFNDFKFPFKGDRTVNIRVNYM